MKLNVIGKTTIYGKEINHIEGGFGEGQKVILAKDVAEIHGIEVKHVNELIKRNLEQYNDDMLVDLKVVAGSDFNFESFGFTKMQVSKAKNIFVLSEQGYMLLVSSMSNDNSKKWEIMGKFITEYFQMREKIKEDKKALPNDYIEALEHLLKSKKRERELEQEIEVMKPKVEVVDDLFQKEDLYTVTQIAKDYGISAKALNKILEEEKVQYKQSNQWLLYSKYQNKGLTHSYTHNVKVGDLDIAPLTTKWTNKGREFIHNLMKKRQEGPVDIIDDIVDEDQMLEQQAIELLNVMKLKK